MANRISEFWKFYDQLLIITITMKTILATTDFTKGSLHAVKYAAALALETGCKLVLVHATYVPVVADTFFDAGSMVEVMEKADQESMKTLVNKLKTDFGSKLKLENKIEIGFSMEVIKKTIKKGDVDLVVMGITHTDAFSKALFGSTSTTLAGSMLCPVLIVPEGSVYRPWKKIAFAFDEKNLPSGKGLKMLGGLTKHFGSTVHFVNVMTNPFTEFDASPLKPVMKSFDQEAVRIHFLKFVKNKVEAIIQDWVSRYKANMLVMVAREHNLLWSMFNERMTKKMAFTTKVPLLIISEK